jgi:hypothetical protein
LRVLGVAGVTLAVAVGVELLGVRHERTVVLRVEDAVVVVIVVARVALAVAVRVELTRIGHAGTIVVRVRDAVAIEVRVAGVALAVLVGVELIGVLRDGTIVRRVQHAVTVVVVVAGVTLAVAVGVELLGVGGLRTIVHGIGEAITVVVELAGVALAVLVGVELIGVLHLRTVVICVQHAVAVVVVVALVALAVLVGVELRLVDDEIAIVLRVGHAVAIVVVVAGVALAVLVGVLLILVRDERAIVLRVGHAVAVVVGVAGVALPVLVGVLLVLVGDRVAVVLRVGDAVAILVVAARTAAGAAAPPLPVPDLARHRALEAVRGRVRGEPRIDIAARRVEIERVAALVIAVPGLGGEVAAVAIAIDVTAVEILLLGHRAEAAHHRQVDALLRGGDRHHVIGIRRVDLDFLPVDGDDLDRGRLPLHVPRRRRLGAADAREGLLDDAHARGVRRRRTVVPAGDREDDEHGRYERAGEDRFHRGGELLIAQDTRRGAQRGFRVSHQRSAAGSTTIAATRQHTSPSTATRPRLRTPWLSEPSSAR